MEKIMSKICGARKTGNSLKYKRNLWLRESGVKEPKECVVER